MTQDDVTQIRVANSPVGIMGLKTVMEEMSGEYADKPDEDVMEEMLHRLGERNYIPKKAEEDYGNAFLREFKKFLGRPYEQEVYEGIYIKVLGHGCTQCDSLEKEVIEAMAEADITGNLEHITNIKEIGQYGVMGMPALIVNGKVKCVGKVPQRFKIIEWLKEASR
ncbi:MAG TPA: thioredoxin family protein [Desulfobacteraceae bacterium]|nr:thioredoxin family protein [Desulfobacteraceae bacterium]HPJ66776.1 thioredoxin family protein [Desulfobacteraceae bacterium]HPQ26986.1 thioredoxin family protein [Desulfobacteraceae bacterium]